jgi:hypothetical protein
VSSVPYVPRPRPVEPPRPTEIPLRPCPGRAGAGRTMLVRRLATRTEMKATKEQTSARATDRTLAMKLYSDILNMGLPDLSFSLWMPG